MSTHMKWIADRSSAVFAAVLLAGLAGSGCVLDWEEDNSPCGNEVLDPGEECEDGNREAGDGCSSGCTVEHGWDCTGTPSYCTTTCGDGVIAAGVEQCDQEGAPVSYDGCSATCQSEVGWLCSGEPSFCTPSM